MSIRINQTIPNFSATTDQGVIDFHQWMNGSWTILFSHPKDFTPVCTTEFAIVAQLENEWQKRNTKVIGISVDSAEQHRNWKKDIESFGGTDVAFPIIADDDMEISKLLDMLPAEAYLPDGRTAADTATVRSVLIIGPDKKLKLTLTYPMNIGRNFDEILRVLDGLQLAAAQNVATPANWSPGDNIVIPVTVSDAEASAKYGEFEKHFSYLRTAQPV
ncbi:MAG: redoxin domain-containing protein [Rhizobiaceae bacterium]|nr:redoxin domain-containing protein [Rhizobiaceae bacterium]